MIKKRENYYLHIFQICIVIFAFFLAPKLFAQDLPAEDLNRLTVYYDYSWCPKFTEPPYNLPEETALSLSSYCGKIVSSNYEGPVSGITVAVYEADPIMPTGKFKGRLTGLYNSTATDAAGRFHITGRKVGPGGFTLYLVFFCNTDQIGSLSLGSTFDNYMLDNMPYVADGMTCTYATPPIEVEIANKHQTLGATVGETGFQGDVPVGSQSIQDLSFNDNSGEKNSDLRFTKLDVIIDGMVFPHVGAYEQFGGINQLDCLVRTGDPYYCNYNGYMEAIGESDYLTSIAFGFIPKLCRFPSERRVEIRANQKQIDQDALMIAQSNYTLFGNYNGADQLLLRAYGSPEASLDVLNDCDCLLAANSVVVDDDLQTKCPDINALTAAGPVSRGSVPREWYSILASEQYETDMNRPACRQRGSLITVREIADCYISGECVNGITKSHFRPELILTKGESYIGTTSRLHSDSKYNTTVKRDNPFHRMLTAKEIPYLTGSATPIQIAGPNDRASGANSSVFSLRYVSHDLVPLDPLSDDHPMSDLLIGPFTPRSDYYTRDAQRNYVYTIGKPISTASIGVPYKDIPAEAETAMKLDNIFMPTADYTEPDGDGAGHSRNFSVSTGAFYSEKAELRDRYFEGNNYSMIGRQTDPHNATSLGEVSDFDLYRGVRSIIDSLYTILSGSGEESISLAGGPGSYQLHVPVQALGNAIDSVFENDGPEKSFGQRDQQDGFPIVNRDELVPVTFPLCEETFNGHFWAPEPPYNIIHDPESWGISECSPWERVGIGQSCNTFRGSVEINYAETGVTETYTDPALDGGFSRTCRVDSCRVYTVTRRCGCDELGNEVNCRTTRDLSEEQCPAGGTPDYNRMCATHPDQTSCLNAETGEYDRDCIYDVFNFDENDLNVSCANEDPADFPCPGCARDSESFPACAMGVVGPYVCTGEMHITNLDGRVKQEIPLNQPTDSEVPPEQKNLDPVVDSLRVIEAAFKSPVELPISGAYKVQIDWYNTNNYDTEPDIYTFGQDMMFPGGSEQLTASIKQYVARPYFEGQPVTDPTAPPEVGIVYHVLPGFGIRHGLDSVLALEQPNRHNPPTHPMSDAPPINYTNPPTEENPLPTNDELAELDEWAPPLYLPPASIEDSSRGSYIFALNTEDSNGPAPDNAAYATQFNDPIPPIVTFGACDITSCGHSSVPDFSNTALNILNSAGERFGVPPAMLVAYMATEGKAFAPPLFDPANNVNYYADDGIVKSWSAEYYGRITVPGQHALCHDLPWSEQGPFQWLQKWFEAQKNTPEVVEALDEFGERRSAWASRCNFLDATYITAAAFQSIGAMEDNGCNWSQAQIDAAGLSISGGAYESGNLGNLGDVFNSCN